MDIEQLIRENVQAVMQETANPTANATTVAAPAPIKMNIQCREVTFRDQADLEAQLNATAATIAAERAAMQAVAVPAHQGSRVTNDEGTGPAFSNDEFIKRMNEDPKTAINYALSHMMFDGQVEDAASLLRETIISQATQAKQLSAYQFKDAYREVPLEDPRVNGAIEATRKELGLPFSNQGLEAAYIYAVNKGRLPDFRALSQQTDIQQRQQAQHPQYSAPAAGNPYLQGPPQTGRSGSGAAPVLVGDIEDMSTEQLGALLNRLAAQGIA